MGRTGASLHDCRHLLQVPARPGYRATLVDGESLRPRAVTPQVLDPGSAHSAGSCNPKRSKGDLKFAAEYAQTLTRRQCASVIADVRSDGPVMFVPVSDMPGRGERIRRHRIDLGARSNQLPPDEWVSRSRPCPGIHREVSDVAVRHYSQPTWRSQRSLSYGVGIAGIRNVSRESIVR